MGAVKAAVGDALITFVWMFCISGLGFATFLITAALEIQGASFSLLVTAALIFVIVFAFNVIADAMGGASFNPAGNAAFYAAGFGEDTLISMALRFPAQVAIDLSFPLFFADGSSDLMNFVVPRRRPARSVGSWPSTR